VPGGVDYEFEMVSSEGACFGEYSQADEHEIEVHVAAGDFGPLTFLTPGGLAQIWEMSFSGAFAGTCCSLRLRPDHPAAGVRSKRALPATVPERRLAAADEHPESRDAHHRGDTDSLGAFALGVDASSPSP